MKNPEYSIKNMEESPVKIEQAPDVPIIDIIRHGETEYKHRQPEDGSREPLDTSLDGFKLDSEYLDLNEEGIETIKATAGQLAGMIDKDKEVVLIISSPSHRAHSSGLIVEKELRAQGISILNAEGDFKFAEALNEASSRMGKVLNTVPDLISRVERHRVEALGFQRFLRHMNNIYKWLTPETLEKLKGKKLRIVCFSHAEISSDFVHETFGTARGRGEGQKRGQILEIRPESQLAKKGEVSTDVKLYPIKEREGREAQISRGFEPKKAE